MKVTITPLTPHPNDPEYRARQDVSDDKRGRKTERKARNDETT